MKRRLLAIMCGFAVQLVGLLLIHSVWLRADYLATAGIWQPMAEQMARVWAMLLSILVYSVGAVLLYKPGPKSEPVWKRGLSFGVLLAMVVVVYGSLSGWVILPVPHSLVEKWIVGEGLLSCVFGVVVAAIVR
jgi:uncharacterized BrkB/YihY/UPF0761 family membrane protein